MSAKFNLVVVSMFKNESWILDEWIRHYRNEGVEHFYLIDNGSTDQYQSQLDAHKDLITLIVDPIRYPNFTQTRLIRKYFGKKVIDEAKWVLVCDVDEYVYSRNQFPTITDMLKQIPSQIDVIHMPWKIYGSSGHVAQPASVLKGFTARRVNVRAKSFPTVQGFTGNGKSLIRVTDQLLLDIHMSIPNRNDKTYKSIEDLYNQRQIYNASFEVIQDEKCEYEALLLHLNHYMFMSRDYYEQIKCQRAGGQSGQTSKYTMKFFDNEAHRYNHAVDTELMTKTYLSPKKTPPSPKKTPPSPQKTHLASSNQSHLLS